MPIAHLLLYVAGDQHGALAALGHVAVGDVRGQLDLRPRADEEPVSRGAQRRDVAHAGGPPWHTLTRRGARTGGKKTAVYRDGEALELGSRKRNQLYCWHCLGSKNCHPS